MMKWFYNLKIAAKLIIGFIIVAIIAGIVGIIGILNIQKMEQLDTDMFVRHTSTMDDLATVLLSYQQQRSVIRDLLLENNDSKMKESINQIDVLDQDIDKSLKIFGDSIRDQAVKDKFNAFSTAFEEYKTYRTKLLADIENNQIEKAKSSLYGEGTEIANKLYSFGDELFALKVSFANQSSNTNTAAAKTATITMIIVVVAGIIIAIVLGIFISRIISKPIIQMVKAADDLAAGDVNVKVEANTKDEIGKLGASFRKMIENIRGQALVVERIAQGDLTVQVNIRSKEDLLGRKLYEMVEKNNEILSGISSASDQVAAGSKQVSDSSVALSQGATEQASTIEELTASLEEISSQTKLNAETADQANLLAESAKSNAVQGNNQMSSMLKAMEEINDSSSNISRIIKVIDDIAFQTNILALNAAVEAARAGQYGKGFAVVAEEVRSLAARSASAAKETTDMIEGSIKKVESGTLIAKETAQALDKIVGGIGEVSLLVNNIAVASNEQAAGITQINQGILQVSEVIQTNSSSSEEGAAASEELSSQADLLKEMVSQFNLKKTAKNSHTLSHMKDPYDHEQILHNKITFSEKDQDNFSGVGQSYDIVLNDSEFGKY